MGKKCHKNTKQIFQLAPLCCLYLAGLYGCVGLHYCALWMKLSQCSMAELRTGATEAAVPGQGQFHRPV